MKLVYIDVLRQVRPEVSGTDIDFVLFGGFDAMKIETEYVDFEKPMNGVSSAFTEIRQLKSMHEQGHRRVATFYDRQPLFLCALGDDDPKKGIFGKSGKKEKQPLVMTLFQTEKSLIRKDRFSDLVHDFEEIIQTMMVQLGINRTGDGAIEFQVFWNLGESDFVVVFRADVLKNIGRLLHRLRSSGTTESGILVLSTCSHCAFPYVYTLEGTENIKKPNGQRLKQNIVEWMNAETQVDNSTNILSLVNTSSGFNSISKAQGNDGSYFLDGFLFGEWDYRAEYKLSDSNSATNVADFILRNFSFSSSGLPNYNDVYRTSYSIPIIKLNEEDILFRLNNSRSDDANNRYEPVNELIGSMTSFTNKIKSLIIDMPLTSWNHAYKTILSFTYSIEGLGKYLIRLDASRFEQDLFVYVKDIFSVFTEINKSYSSQLDALLSFFSPFSSKDEEFKKRCREQITNIFREYVEDTAKLVSGLQHLFAVLVVSPHTFLETFGSSMRSMVAAFKLVIAYQGIVKYLDATFAEKIVLPDTTTEKTCFHRFLILPYRKAASQSSILFHFSAPTNRLTYIQIDYSLMFIVKDTIFVLLHEAAHIIGERHRVERYDFFVKAVFRYLFGKVLGNFLQDTEKHFSHFLNDTKREGDNHRVIQLPTDILEAFQEQIKAIINGLSNLMCEHCKEDYTEYCKNNQEIEDRIALTNYFFDQAGKHIKVFIYDALIDFHSAIESGVWQWCVENTMEAGKNAAHELVLWFSANGNPDLRAAIYLCERYNQYQNMKHILEMEYVEEFIHATKDSYIEIVDSLVNVFRDVFADIFSIRILGLSNGNEYLEILPKFTGTDLRKTLTGTSNVIRLWVVLQTCFPGSNLCSCLDNLGIADSDTISSVQNNLKNIEDLTYLKCITDYAALINKKITTDITQLSPAQENARNILQRMYKSELADVLDGMYYFWKYSME